MYDDQILVQQGWQCPNCGNIISPNMMWCPFCSGEKKITYTTTTTSDPLDSEEESVKEVVKGFMELVDATKENKIICPKCGRSDYIRSFEKDFGIKNSEYEYKCINCNTYIGWKGESE